MLAGQLCLLFMSTVCKTNKLECISLPLSAALSDKTGGLGKLHSHPSKKWRTHEAEVDVSPELHPILEVASDASNHAEQQCLLHIFVSKDLWSKAGCQNTIDVFLF